MMPDSSICETHTAGEGEWDWVCAELLIAYLHDASRQIPAGNRVTTPTLIGDINPSNFTYCALDMYIHLNRARS